LYPKAAMIAHYSALWASGDVVKFWGLVPMGF
jgi:hypothetical protein